MLIGFNEGGSAPCGHRFTDPDLAGMVTLANSFGFNVDQRHSSATWLCTALIANLPRLDELLAMLSAEAQTHQQWIEQAGAFEWSETGHHPRLDGNIECCMYELIDGIQALLRDQLPKVVSWLKGGRHSRLFGRLVWGCTATLLQKGREVVAGAAAYGCGRKDNDVLCILPGDKKLADNGIRRTVVSAINTMPMTVMGQLCESETLFARLPHANSSCGWHERHGDFFVAKQFAGNCFEASTWLGDDCPDDVNAPHLLCCACPESPGLRHQMLRLQLFVSSWATHHLSSNCSPATIAMHARARGLTVPASLLLGLEVRKEQCLVTLSPNGSALTLRTATDLSIDIRSTFRLTASGSDLSYQLNPAALNLAAMLLQPARDSRPCAWEQTCLVAQVLSLVSGELSGRRLNDKLLLTDAQIERSETTIRGCNREYIATRASKRPKYEK